MGRGTRHSKSCQIKPYFTYDERNSRSNVYRGLGTTRIALDESTGTMVQRVGTDSQKQFDACWLCNQRAEDPVTTKYGLLYCRACIVEHMVKQKKEIKRKMEQYEEQEKLKGEKDATKALVGDALKEAAARSVEEAILPTSGTAMKKEIETKQGKIEEAAETDGKQAQKLNSFWVAHNTPVWTEASMAKPDQTIKDPFSNKPLKLKHLRSIVWTEQREASGKDLQSNSSTGRYMCPISNTTFKNGVAISILPDGSAVSKKGLQKVWEDASGQTFKCPLTSETILKKDVIDLAKAGTAFAASTQGEELGATEAKKYRHSLTMAIS